MEILNDAMIVLSLSLSVPLLSQCFEVASMWQELAWESFRKEYREDPGGALARGIYVGFISTGLDNLYWFVTWSLVLLDYEFGVTMMLGGSGANVLFRQTGGLYASYEHIKAAHEKQGKSMRNRQRDRFNWIAAAVFAVVLIYFNDWN